MKASKATTALDGIARRLPPPPSAPLPLAALDLELTRLLLQCELPADYLAFLGRYGGGAIPGLLRVLDPCAATSQGHPVRQLIEQLDAMNGTRLLVWWKRGVAKGTGEFLPWAIADNGTLFYLRTLGPPATWTVAIGAKRVPPQRLRDYPLSMTGFMADLLAGKVDDPDLPALPASLVWVATDHAVPPVVEVHVGAPKKKKTAAPAKKVVASKKKADAPRKRLPRTTKSSSSRS